MNKLYSVDGKVCAQGAPGDEAAARSSHPGVNKPLKRVGSPSFFSFIEIYQNYIKSIFVMLLYERGYSL